MTPAERAAVHRLAGAFSRLSLAAELAVYDPAGQLPALERVRKLALQSFAGAMSQLEQLRAERDAKPPDIFEIMCDVAAASKPSSAACPQPPDLPRAAEAPAPSTTPRDCPPDAGGGRAVSPAPSSGKRIADVALELAARGPFYAGQLADLTGKPVETCRTTCWQLAQRGLLKFTPPPGGPGRGRSGKYEAAVPVEQLVLPPSKRGAKMALARTSEPAGDETDELARYGVRRVPVEQAAISAPRAPVTGVHRSVADFFAAKEPLPAARPPVFQERGARHG